MDTTKPDRTLKKAKEEPPRNWAGWWNFQPGVMQDITLDNLPALTEYVGLKTSTIPTAGENWSIEQLRQKEDKIIQTTEEHGRKPILGFKTLSGVIFTSTLEQEIMKMFENTVARAIDEIIEEDRIRNEIILEKLFFDIIQAAYHEISCEDYLYRNHKATKLEQDILDEMCIDVIETACNEMEIEENLNEHDLNIIDNTMDLCLEHMLKTVTEAAFAELSEAGIEQGVFVDSILVEDNSELVTSKIVNYTSDTIPNIVITDYSSGAVDETRAIHIEEESHMMSIDDKDKKTDNEAKIWEGYHIEGSEKEKVENNEEKSTESYSNYESRRDAMPTDIKDENTEEMENVKIEKIRKCKAKRIDDSKIRNDDLGDNVPEKPKTTYVKFGNTKIKIMNETKHMLQDIMIAAGEGLGKGVTKPKKNTAVDETPKPEAVVYTCVIAETKDNFKTVPNEETTKDTRPISDQVDGIMKDIELAEDAEKSYVIIDNTKIEIMDETKKLLGEMMGSDNITQLVEELSDAQKDAELMKHGDSGIEINGTTKSESTDLTQQIITDEARATYEDIDKVGCAQLDNEDASSEDKNQQLKIEEKYPDGELLKKVRLYVQDIIIVAAHRVREEERIVAEIEEASKDIDEHDSDDTKDDTELQGQSGSELKATGTGSAESDLEQSEEDLTSSSTITEQKIGNASHTQFVSDLVENILNDESDSDGEVDSDADVETDEEVYLDAEMEVTDDAEQQRSVAHERGIDNVSIDSARFMENAGRWKRFRNRFFKLCGLNK